MARKPGPLYERAIVQDLRAVRKLETVSASTPEMDKVTRLQRLGLVRVRPVTKHVANVELTDAGRAAMEQEGV